MHEQDYGPGGCRGRGRQETKQHRVAVVGAAGFIGRHLVTELNSARVPVISITRDTPMVRDCRLTDSLLEAQVIFYLATSVNIPIAERSPERVAADHQQFAELLRLLSTTAQPRLVVLASSGAVYDPAASPPYSEDAPTRPASAYAKAKLALEEELGRYSSVLPHVVLRLANVYGPGLRTGTGYGVITHWLMAALERRSLTMFGDPRARRDYVYISDAVEAMAILAFRRSAPDQTRFNIGSGTPCSLAGLRSVVEEVVGRPLPVVPADRGHIDRRDTWLDPSRAEHQLKWRARTSLRDGIARTWRALNLSLVND